MLLIQTVLEKLLTLSWKKEHSNMFSYQTLHVVLTKGPRHIFFVWMSKSHTLQTKLSSSLINPASCAGETMLLGYCLSEALFRELDLAGPPGFMLPCLLWLRSFVSHAMCGTGGKWKMPTKHFKPWPFSAHDVLVYRNRLSGSSRLERTINFS